MLGLFSFLDFFSSICQNLFDFFHPKLNILGLIGLMFFFSGLILVVDICAVILVRLKETHDLEIAIDANETLLVLFEFRVCEEQDFILFVKPVNFEHLPEVQWQLHVVSPFFFYQFGLPFKLCLDVCKLIDAVMTCIVIDLLDSYSLVIKLKNSVILDLNELLSDGNLFTIQTDDVLELKGAFTVSCIVDKINILAQVEVVP
jgi:hypothetical protein